MLDPHISKVRDFVIAVEKLTARNDVFFFFLFKSPTENAPSLFLSLSLYTSTRRFSNCLDESSENFNGQNPFVLVPHINKKVAGVKTRKKRVGAAISSPAGFITSTLAKKGGGGVVFFPLVPSFLFITGLSCESCRARFRVKHADLQNQ